MAGRHVQVLLKYPRYTCGTCSKALHPDLPESSVLDPLQQMVAAFVLSGDITSASQYFALERRQVAEIAQSILSQHLEVEAEKVPVPVYLGVDVTRVLGRDCIMLVDLKRGKHVEMLDKGWAGFDILSRYLREQRPAWEDTLECIVVDPHKPLKKAITDAWPGVKIILDRYHVSQLINSKITKWAASYKEQHGLKGDVRSLRHPWRDAYQPLADRLSAEGHGILVVAHEYARRVRQVYEAPNSREAREVWLDWVDALPAALQPVLGSTIKDLDNHWRIEICNAADYHMPSKNPKDEDVVLSNGMTEALHKRLKGVVGSATRLGFESMRTRLLLTETSEERKEDARGDQLQLKEVRALLSGEAARRAATENTTLVLPPLGNAHHPRQLSPGSWALADADADD